MINFIELKKKRQMDEYHDGALCTLYLSPTHPQKPKYLIRRFDQQLGPKDVEPFANIIINIRKWVNDRPEFSNLVTVEPPIEVGQDYIMRRFHIYTTPIYAYEEWTNPPEPPTELYRMRSVLSDLTGKPRTAKEAIIERILTRSLLGAAGKTYFHDQQHCFIVVEPKINQEDIRDWAAL